VFSFDYMLACFISVILVMVVIGFTRLMSGSAAKKWKAHRAETVELWEADGVEFVLGPSGGRFCGLESMGDKFGERDFGIIAITTEDLRVTRMSPTTVWSIPFNEFESIAFETEFMGNRAAKTPFIVVEFTQNEQVDTIGFQIAAYDEWAEKLADLANVPLYELEE